MAGLVIPISSLQVGNAEVRPNSVDQGVHSFDVLVHVSLLVELESASGDWARVRLLSGVHSQVSVQLAYAVEYLAAGASAR